MALCRGIRSKAPADAKDIEEHRGHGPLYAQTSYLHVMFL
jgi:hypothetical protein